MFGSLFFERRDVLKCRSALLAVADVVRTCARPGSEALAGEVEEVVSSAHPFNELRVLSGLRAGWVSGKDEVVAELEQRDRRRGQRDPPAAAAAAGRGRRELTARGGRRAGPLAAPRGEPDDQLRDGGRRPGGDPVVRGHVGRPFLRSTAMYALGIDLGTTYTAAAVWRDGRAQIVSLGGRGAAIPSVVLLREDETFLTGEAANRRGLTEPQPGGTGVQAPHGRHHTDHARRQSRTRRRR